MIAAMFPSPAGPAARRRRFSPVKLLRGLTLLCLACPLGAADEGRSGGAVTADLPPCVILTLDRAAIDVVIGEANHASLEAGLSSPDPDLQDPVVDLSRKGACLLVARSLNLGLSQRLDLALTLSARGELRVEGRDLELEVASLPAEGEAAAPTPADGSAKQPAHEGERARLKLTAKVEDSTLSLAGQISLHLSATGSRLLLEGFDGPAALELTESVADARDLTGDLAVTGSASRVSIDDQAGGATIDLTGGSLDVSRGEGRLGVEGQDTEVTVLARRGDLHLAGTGGNLTVADLPGGRHRLQIEMQGGQVEARSVDRAMKLKLGQGASAELEDLTEDLTLKAIEESRIEARRISTANLRLEDSFLEVRQSHRLNIKAKGSILGGDMVDGLEAELTDTELQIEMGPHPIEPKYHSNASLVTFPVLHLAGSSHALLTLPGPCELWLPPDEQIPPDHLDPGPCPVRHGTEWRGGARSVSYDSEGHPFQKHPLKVIADLDESSSLSLRAAP